MCPVGHSQPCWQPGPSNYKRVVSISLGGCRLGTPDWLGLDLPVTSQHAIFVVHFLAQFARYFCLNLTQALSCLILVLVDFGEVSMELPRRCTNSPPMLSCLLSRMLLTCQKVLQVCEMFLMILTQLSKWCRPS